MRRESLPRFLIAPPVLEGLLLAGDHDEYTPERKHLLPQQGCRCPKPHHRIVGLIPYFLLCPYDLQKWEWKLLVMVRPLIWRLTVCGLPWLLILGLPWFRCTS